MDTQNVVLSPQWDRVGRYLARVNGADHNAMGGEDYAQAIRMAILEAQKNHPGKAPGYYVRTGWNAAWSYKRRDKARAKWTASLEPDSYVWDAHLNHDPTDWLEARSCTSFLESALSPQELTVLELASQGDLRRCFQTRQQTHRALKRARQAAQSAEQRACASKRRAVMTEKAKEKVPECFGVSFSIQEQACVQQCAVRNACVEKIRTEYLPSMIQQQSMPADSVSNVATLLEADTDTAQVLYQLFTDKSLTAEKLLPKQEDEDEEPAEKKPEEKKEAAPPPPPAPPVEAKESPEDPPKKKVKKAKEPKKAKEAPAEKVEEKAEGEKKVEDKAEAQQEMFKPAEVSATPLVQEKEKKVKTVKKKAKAQKAKKASGPKKTPVISEFAAYERELLKSAYVAELKHGQILSREWDGKDFQLVVDRKEHAYVLNGKKFPTVYAATASITGMKGHPKQNGKPGKRMMTSWSSSRFWGAPSTGGVKKKTPKKK